MAVKMKVRQNSWIHSRATNKLELGGVEQDLIIAVDQVGLVRIHQVGQFLYVVITALA